MTRKASMPRLVNIYFVSETGAAIASSIDANRPGAREAIVNRMEDIGYGEATYKEYLAKRAWQRRREKKELEE